MEEDVQTQAVDVQETTTPVPSTEENKTTEAEDPILAELQNDEDKSPEDTEVKEEEAEKPTEDPETEETEQEKPKAKNEANNRIRTLANENRELKQHIEQLNAQVYKPQSVEELIAEGETEAMAAVKAMQQEREFDKYNQHVTEINNAVESEAEAALKDFAIFNPESPEYNAELTARADELYMQAAGIQRDPNTGLVNDAKVLPYNFYKAFAEIAKSSATQGQVQAQKAVERQLSNVDAPTSASAPTKKVDPILEELLKD
jgi:hypothetical protein